MLKVIIAHWHCTLGVWDMNCLKSSLAFRKPAMAVVSQGMYLHEPIN